MRLEAGGGALLVALAHGVGKYHHVLVVDQVPGTLEQLTVFDRPRWAELQPQVPILFDAVDHELQRVVGQAVVAVSAAHVGVG